MCTVVTSCVALDGHVILATSQAMPMEESYRWTKDLEFMARECRAMAKAALRLRENRHGQKELRPFARWQNTRFELERWPQRPPSGPAPQMARLFQMADRGLD